MENKENNAEKLMEYLKKTFEDALSGYTGDPICMESLPVIQNQVSEVLNSENMKKVFPNIEVVCDNTNNSPKTIDEGELNCTLLFNDYVDIKISVNGDNQ